MHLTGYHRGRCGVLAPAAFLLLALCLLAGGAQALTGHDEKTASAGAGETGRADPSADLTAPSPAAHSVPGTIQAEDYDTGGEGVAYHDTTPGNEGGAYRNDGVDIEVQGDVCNVGWVRDGEWLTYTAAVAQAGTYMMTARAASPNSGRSIAVQVDGAPAGTIAVPNTGSFAAFQDARILVTLAPGPHTIRLTFAGDGQNLDWISFAALTPALTPYVNVTIPCTLQAENYDLGGEGLAYHDTTAGNAGGAYRQDGVDVATTGDGHAVVGIEDGEWLVYTIGGVSPTPQLPALVLYLGSDRDGGRVEIEVNGRTAGTVSVPNTGSPTAFKAVQTQAVAATGTLRLLFRGSGMGMDRIESPVLVATGDDYNWANFTADRTNGTAPLTVRFADTSSEFAYGWAWDFGDGATSTEQNPVHTFQRAGVYNVSLNVRVADHWLGGVYIGIWNDLSHGKTVQVTVEGTGPALVTVPGGAGLPADTDCDGKYDDVNGNDRKDFADVVLYFTRTGWIAANEPLSGFDYNANGRIDFADVVWLFAQLGSGQGPASVFPTVNVTEPGLYRFSAAEVQAVRRATPYEWAQWRGPPESRTSMVDPMQILGMYPLLSVSDGFVLRAYVTNDMMGGSGTVFALPAGQAFPPPGTPVNYSPALGTGLPPGADLNFTEYIEVEGSPASYLEAVVCSIELRSFAEFWHSEYWRARAFLDSKPPFSLIYTGPEPETWSPTVRVGPSETRVVFHTLSSRTGVLYEDTVRFIRGTPGCEWSSSLLAYGGPGYTP